MRASPAEDVSIELARAGAHKVLSECLQLKHGNRVALFYDNETIKPAQLLIEEACHLGLKVKRRFVPVRHQRIFDPETGLCGNCRAALYDAAAVITCLSSGSDTTAYRSEVLRQALNGTTKVGHIPGANLFLLASAINVDYDDAVARCEDLALALTLGERATLTSYVVGPNDEIRTSHQLQIDLGGFKRMPVVSTGVVPQGTWGNLPGGETFIAPMECAAHGEIAINGAFKNHVFAPEESLIFSFEAGRICRRPQGSDEVLRAFDSLLDRARSRGDRYCESLAELGIGVNVSVTKLTGNSIFDEKCAGTVHIALGDNSGFGGKHRSEMHEDFITRLPSLTIDDKLILDKGANVFQEDDWYEDIDTFPVDQRLVPSSRVTRSSSERAITRGGVLKVNHLVAAGRICMYRVGKKSQSAAFLHLYNELPGIQSIKLAELTRLVVQRHGLTALQVARGVSILMRHRLVSLN